MKVGIVCPYDLAAPGGVQQLCSELVMQLRTAGEEAVLVGVGDVRHSAGPGWDESTIPVGRPFKVRANDSTVPLTISPRSWSRIGSALSEVDIVHVHEPMVPLAGWAALRIAKPKVATFHADPPGWVRPLYRLLPGLGRRMRAATLTAVSEAARAAMPLSWGAVRVIPNAIDVSAYQPPVGRIGNRIAFLGRDEPRKGLDIALGAFAIVHQRRPETELVVIGADRSSNPPGVRFVGRVSQGEKRRILASSAIFIAPNTGGESFGMVLTEAMAAGCAVVASELLAFRAVLGDHGVLFPVGDVKALADAVIGLLDHPDRRDSLSVAARTAVQRYDWSVVLTQYRAAYADAIASG